MDIQTYLKKRKIIVDENLKRLAPPVDGHHRNVVEAMRYSLFAGGKRIRPILCMAGAEAVGGDADAVITFACAIEFIHTYSLIHDDLPGMDDDDLRRGVPTCHKRFGEAAAILAGDALLTEAFYIMTGAELTDRTDPLRLLQASHLLTDASGFRGMVGGQMADVEAEGKPATLDLVQFIHESKTAALIRASVASGALLAGAGETEFEALSTYGKYLGLAFQVRDDILDEVGDTEVMGKPKGSDRDRNKATYPSVLGLEKSRESEREMIESALSALSALDGRSEPLRALALYLLERSH